MKADSVVSTVQRQWHNYYENRKLSSFFEHKQTYLFSKTISTPKTAFKGSAVLNRSIYKP